MTARLHSPPPWHHRPTPAPRHQSVNLSNALNVCFARPSDDTILRETCHIQPHIDSIVPSVHDLLSLRRRLGNSIFGFQDKNLGACTIECPCIQHAREKRMYYDNHTNFAHVDYLNPREYHLLFSRIHILYDLARIAPFPRFYDMQPPICLLLPKA